MNPTLINKNSPGWIGLQHALLSFVLIFVFGVVLILGFPDFFGFFFSTTKQLVMLYGTATLLATFFSSATLFSVLKKVRNQSVLRASLAWFAVFHALMITTMLLFAEPTYGSTAYENLIEMLFVDLSSLAAFLIVSWPYLRNRVGN